MVNNNTDLDASVHHILAHGDVCGILPEDYGPKMGLGDGDELLYLVNKAFDTIFSRQVLLLLMLLLLL